MNEVSPIYKSDPVLTADHYQLGQAVRLYHRQDEIHPDEELFPDYLMVANLDIGDEFYVPLHYITAYDAPTGTHTLSLTLAEVGHEQLSNMPRFIAFREATDEALPLPPTTRLELEGQQHIKTMPLPPNWR